MTENGGFNILSKDDRSGLPVFGAKTLAIRRAKYDWSTGGSCGKFEWVDKNDLNIDGRYQREQCSDSKVRSIAAEWDWLLLGTLSVIRREDGSLWVFDGGHRARASFFRDDVPKLPCMIHEVDGVNAEAKAFVARNTMVSNVAAMDRYKASVVANEPVAKKTRMLLDELGLSASTYSGSGKIQCIGAVQKCVSENYEMARKSLLLCMQIAGDSSVVGAVLSAIFTLQMHFLPEIDVIDMHGEKLAKHSQKELEMKINQFSAECGGARGHTIAAKALMHIANHKTRTRRLEW